MNQRPAVYQVGNATVTKIPEVELAGFKLRTLLPDLTETDLEHLRSLDPTDVLVPADETAILSVHTWLVRTPKHTILVDTGIGNHKHRPTAPIFHQLQSSYLDRLSAAGVETSKVDYVLLTHIHADHVGWNTRLDQQANWVPTFPNATYMFSAREQKYAEGLDTDPDRVAGVLADADLGDPVRRPLQGPYRDSVAPLVEAGRAYLIDVDGSEVFEGVTFLPTAGHSIDHAAIIIRSGGEEAIFGGDVFHHPAEIYQPKLTSMFCEFPAASRLSRRQLLDRAAESGAIYFSSHFSGTSAGRISRRGSNYEWRYI
jgi:glyoxylase-like metal-dependent hydrolase (beta-lactamase superfamily II)